MDKYQCDFFFYTEEAKTIHTYICVYILSFCVYGVLKCIHLKVYNTITNTVLYYNTITNNTLQVLDL